MRAAVGLTAATMALAACSSSGGKAAPSSSGSSAASGSTSTGTPATGTGSSGVAAAKQFLDSYVTKPTKIAITTPLSKAPPTGKKVFFITPQSGDWQRWTGALKEAGKVLGWSVTILSSQGTPADYNGLAQQAIQQGANYLAVAAAVFPTNNPLVAAAKAAKVPLFLYSTDQTPQGATNGIFAAVGKTSEYAARGTLLADQVIVATNGKAKAVLFNTPQFIVFKTLEAAFRAEYKKNCPGCSLDVIETPISDVLAGKASSSVVSYFRSHAGTNAIAVNTSSFLADLPMKAKAAGIKIGNGGILMVLGALGDGQLSWVGDGTAVSGQGTPYELVGWQLADAMARYSVGDSIEPNWKLIQPEYLYTASNSPTGTKPYEGPSGYQSQYTALWKK